LSEIDKKLEEVANVVNVLHSQHRDQEHQAILDWLTPIDYGPQQTDYIRRRQQGTGQWLLDSPQFHAWRETDKQTLFCPGIPGAGKTVLASIVINHLSERFQTNADIGIAYIYFSYKQNVDKQNVDNLLSSLLKQLSQEQPSLPDSVKALHDQYRNKRTRPSIDELSRALQSVAAIYSRVFIVIDALDECQAANGCRARFLTEVFNLLTKAGANLFATSRFIPEITDRFKGSISLEIRASEEDVRRYLEGHMSKLPTFVGNSSDLQEEVKAGIVKAVDGM
jgi:hypothetical protein